MDITIKTPVRFEGVDYPAISLVLEDGLALRMVNSGVATKSNPDNQIVPIYGIKDFNGNIIGLINPKDGSTISLGSKPEPSEIKSITVYNSDGTTSKRCFPKKERLLKSGAKWFTPTALAANAARTVELDATGAFISSDSSASAGVIINCLTGGYVGGTSWSGLNLTMPNDGLLQALVWVDDYQNGAPWSTGSFVIRLTGASGYADYTFAAGVFKPGWNTLQLWNPATAADAICTKAGVSSVVVSGYNFIDNITSVALTINNFTLNAVCRFAGIWTQTKVKAMVAMTFDTSAHNIFTNFLQAWESKGLRCSLRSGGTDSYRNSTWNTPLEAAYATGHDVYNGSWTRLNLNSSTTSAEFAKEVGLQANYMQKEGFSRGATLFSSAGNALPKASIYRDILAKFGLKSAKGGTGFYQGNIFGAAGLDDRYYLTVKGYPGINTAKSLIDSAIYLGGLIMFFGHECPTGRVTVGTPSPGNGGGIWAEDVPELADYISQKSAAGLLECVTASQIDDILDGKI